MKLTTIAASTVAMLLAFGTGAAVAHAESAASTPAASVYTASYSFAQDRDDHRDGDQWDAAPNGYNEIQMRGYREGMEGARKDFGNHRSENPNNRDEYKHPHDVPHSLDRDYRRAFREGYRRAWRHLAYGDRDHDRNHDRDHDHRD